MIGPLKKRLPLLGIDRYRTLVVCLFPQPKEIGLYLAIRQAVGDLAVSIQTRRNYHRQFPAPKAVPCIQNRFPLLMPGLENAFFSEADSLAKENSKIPNCQC